MLRYSSSHKSAENGKHLRIYGLIKTEFTLKLHILPQICQKTHQYSCKNSWSFYQYPYNENKVATIVSNRTVGERDVEQSFKIQ